MSFPQNLEIQSQLYFDLLSRDSVKFKNCLFQENQNECILIEGNLVIRGPTEDFFKGSLSLEGCHFLENGEIGGHTIKSTNTNLLLRHCHFFKDGVQVENTNLTVDSCTFIQGNAVLGGAIQCINSISEFYYSNFQENVDLGSYDIIDEGSFIHGGGGAIYNDKGRHYYKKCLFERNSEYAQGGGAILSKDSNLIFESCDFIGNTSFSRASGDSRSSGGAILSVNCNTIIDSCRFENNTSEIGSFSTCELKGPCIGGGAIHLEIEQENPFKFNEIRNSIFKYNSAKEGRGGGIWISGTTEISNCIFSQNTSPGEGAGIYSTGETKIQGCTIDHNTSESKGGGIFLIGSLELLNTTLSGNSSPQGSEISLDKYGTQPDSIPTRDKLLISHSTVVNNSDNIGNSLIQVHEEDTIILKNSILLGGNSLIHSSTTAQSLSQGYNLISDTTLSRIQAMDTDLLGNARNPVIPLIDTLRNNGGPTPTHALLPGSLAISSGEPIITSSATLDQRGYSRIRGLSEEDPN